MGAARNPRVNVSTDGEVSVMDAPLTTRFAQKTPSRSACPKDAVRELKSGRTIAS